MTDTTAARERAQARRNYIVFCAASTIFSALVAVGALLFIGAI